MPPPSSRMTKNAKHLFRYRPGKAEAEDSYSDEEESDEEEQKEQTKAPPPKASSFPSQKKLAVDLSKADKQVSNVPRSPQRAEDDLEGFVTASESEEDRGEDDDESEEASDSEEEDSEEEEESSSDGESKKPLLAPKFLSKSQRSKQHAGAKTEKTSEELAAEAAAMKQEKSNALLQAQIERDARARAAGKKYWDDEDVAPEDEVDDTDDLDPEAERAAWKLRELRRIRRDRLAIEEKEKEREEIERRRNMTAQDREKEDAEHIEQQKDDRESRGKMAYMQKYFHKGAFFQGDDDQDEEVKAALNRDLAGARFVDDASGKDALPEYMRVRDMTRLGKKGRTRYKDLKSEDTGRWAEYRDLKRDGHHREGGQERSGPNAQPIGERRRRDDDDGRDREKRQRYN